MIVFRKMFELNMFWEIGSYKLNILNTTEYNVLNDWIDLDYNEELCIK